MATTVYTVGDPGTIDRFSSQVYSKAVWGSILFNPSLGLWGKPGSGRPFINFNDFTVGDGLEITCHLTGDLEGDPFRAGADLTGKGNTLPVDTFSFQIATMKTPPIPIEDEESQQAVNWDLAVDARRATAEYASRLWEAGGFMQMCGATFQSAANYFTPSGAQIRANITGNPDVHPDAWTWHNPTSVPTTGREFFPNGVANAQSLTDTDVLDTTFLNQMIHEAQKKKPPILPANIFGGRFYLFFIDTAHRDQLMTKDTHFELVNRAMLQGGLPGQESAYTTGSLIPWNGAVFIASNWMPPGQNSSTAVAVANTKKIALVGQNAMVFGHGKGHSKRKLRWMEERFNLGAVRFNGKSLYGGKKVTWTEADGTLRDNAILVGTTYAADTGDA